MSLFSLEPIPAQAGRADVLRFVCEAGGIDAALVSRKKQRCQDLTSRFLPCMVNPVKGRFILSSPRFESPGCSLRFGCC
jgi:hypothetical protein